MASCKISVSHTDHAQVQGQPTGICLYGSFLRASKTQDMVSSTRRTMHFL